MHSGWVVIVCVKLVCGAELVVISVSRRRLGTVNLNNWLFSLGNVFLYFRRLSFYTLHLFSLIQMFLFLEILRKLGIGLHVRPLRLTNFVDDWWFFWFILWFFVGYFYELGFSQLRWSFAAGANHLVISAENDFKAHNLIDLGQLPLSAFAVAFEGVEADIAYERFLLIFMLVDCDDQLNKRISTSRG